MKTEQLDKEQFIIHGQRTVLIPFEKFDIPDLIRLLREDKNGNMGKFCLKDFTYEQAEYYVSKFIADKIGIIWNFYALDTDGRAGFIFLTDITGFSASISGIVDDKFIKALPKEIRKIKPTYAYDAQKTLIEYCFNNGMLRIETDVMEDNRKAIMLQKKLGFIQEGVLRKCFEFEGKYKNIVNFSILKEEYNNG